MKRFLAIALILISGTALGQPGGDLRVLSEDARSIVLEFRPSLTRDAIPGDDGRAYTRFQFAGALTLPGDAGSPMVSFRASPLVLPSRAFSMHILAADYKEERGISLAPNPGLRHDKEFGVVPFYARSTTEDRSMEYVPSSVAELVDVGDSRGMTIGTLKLYPVQTSMRSDAVRLYSRIVVRIEFGAPHTVPDGASALMTGKYLNTVPQQVRSSLAKTAADSPLAQGEWYGMEVKEPGVYKLDQSFFTGAGVSSVTIGSINSIRIFGQGGGELPESLQGTRPEGMEEIARLVVDRNNNGVLDADDFILFYGKGTRGWKYNASQRTFSHTINHYTETNRYFFTVGGSGRGRDMGALASNSLAGAYKPADFQGKVFVEQELNKDQLTSGRQWWGQLFDNFTTSAVHTTSLPGVEASKPVRYNIVVLSRSASVDTFRVQENNQNLGSVLTLPINLSTGTFEDYFYRSPVTSFTRTGVLPNNRSVLRFIFGTLNQAAKGWLDWFEIFYRQRFEAQNDLLLFASPDTTAVVEYTVSAMSSRDVYAFDVTDHKNVRSITNLTFDPADASFFRFQISQNEGTVREFAAVGRNGFKTPGGVKKLPNSNLTGITNGAEFIIIAPQEFLAEANRLKAHRESRDQLSTLVVDVEHIFNEFSTGLADPMAIRDFLKHAYSTWTTRPRYVLLFGGANFDYKNIRSEERNWIPPYESLESIHEIFTYTSDDHFVFLDPNAQRISLAIGRLPVRSVQQAKDVIDKIIAYESNTLFDSWRNRTTFVADDGLTSTTDDGSLHTGQADIVAQSSTPASFQREKIYLIEYPTINTSTGRRKPSVNQAIVDAINRGTLILNYTGHGNPSQWAHENVFSKGEDFSKIKNEGRPFLVVAATCDYARFDDPKAESAGELLLLMQNAGSIGTVTAARVVYSGENFELNKTFFSFLFQRDGQGSYPRLGDAWWATKQIHNTLNDMKHHLLGDPTLRLAAPRSIVSIDTINNEQAIRATFLPTLGTVRLNGTVRNADSSFSPDFNGRALLEVFDSKRNVIVPEWGNYQFEVNGSLLYRGEITVTNGKYQAAFPIPKDVSYDGNRARMALYSWSGSTDASGYFENIFISGTAPAGTDTAGPEIVIRFDDPSFRPGDFVGTSPLLIVDLSDESGINTSTAGIGHRLEAALNGSSQVFDLTNSYRGNLDTYQSGQVRRQLSELPEGRHTISVKAWDIHNNSSLAETFFEVRTSSTLSIYNVFNYPNPFNRTTTFTFQRNSPDPVDVEIRIYTVAGRVIQSFEVASVVDRFVQIPWDGRDKEGSEIANGVYFYKVIARSLDRSSTSEVLGRLSVLR
ncbi:MAG: hypothetical protein A2059_00580 [Ignavibacteria bacterium GWA2_55_25]|nr:MAG: hypothetical protein A2059_00580 [Ignavibacteria bacterium GWA2_55_25]